MSGYSFEMQNQQCALFAKEDELTPHNRVPCETETDIAAPEHRHRGEGQGARH
jgi:hypothetical protein